MTDRLWFHAPALTSAVIDDFLGGMRRPDIVRTRNLTNGQVSGILERGRACRALPPGREAEMFDAADSRRFRDLVGKGLTYATAGAELKKAPTASRAHAVALGLVEGKAVAQAQGARVHDRNEPAMFATPEEARRFKDADDRLVQALILAGGFNRYDDGLDWLLDMGGRRIVPVSAAGKAEFLDAMRAKHGDAVIAFAAA